MRELIKNLKFAWTYVKGQKKGIFIFLLCKVVTMVIGLVVPIISASIIINLTSSEFKQLLYMAIILFLVESLRNFMGFISNNTYIRIYRETFIKLQTELGREMLKINNESLNNHGSGVFIQRLNGDTSRISEIFNRLISISTGVISDIGVFFAIFIINKYICICIISMVLITYFIDRVRIKIYNENDKKYRKEQEKVSGFTSEIVRGARDIRMLSAEDSFMSTLYKKISDLNVQRYKMQKTNSKYSLLRSSIMDLNDLLVVILLIIFISNNSLEVAYAVVIYNYSFQVLSISSILGMLMECIKDFNLSSTRIFEIFESDEFKKESFGSKHLNKIEGNFEFKNVGFSYSDKTEVFKDLSFKINKNETVAFVGKSGAGKTTIFNLLCKMYDVTEGKILIDGEDINTLDRKSIRDNITIISQNPYIFNLSIRDNLKLVKENLTEEEMKEACKAACLDEFINKLPDKYDTIVGEGGVTLSGGQRQRLAIARALVQKTEIILFDEATSALDNETQNEIQKAINNLKGEYTILIIAHRLSTVINSDRILLINGGKVEAEGTHQELLKNSEFYQGLYTKEL